MAVIPVALSGRGYDVHVARGLLEQAGELAAPFLRKEQVPVVADANAWAMHGRRLEAGLAASGRTAAVYEVAPGELPRAGKGLHRSSTGCWHTGSSAATMSSRWAEGWSATSPDSPARS